MLKNKLGYISLLAIFMGMYTLLDSFNLSYQKMIQQYGVYLVIINICLNLLMAFLSAKMLSHSAKNLKETKASNASFLSIVFGIFTYGCTSCVITFLATFGITFSVAVLPLAGLPYKFISLILLIVGYYWSQREIKNAVCKIKTS